jgi:flavin reductase (DIM6/NTAB) family NADH-FMN oxidoreductase RutF
MSFAIQRINYSYELFADASEFVLAVPGESLAAEAMVCGALSGRHDDKVDRCGLRLVHSAEVSVPGLAEAIANIELVGVGWQPVGDHAIVTGEVRRFAVNTRRAERPLLSIGPDTSGFELLAHQGIHRIGVVSRPA